MAYRTRNITVGARLFRFMAFITRNYNDPYQSSIRTVTIRRDRTDRTNRNILCGPDVIRLCTLRMCSEYGLLVLLTVCTERTIRTLFLTVRKSAAVLGRIGHDCESTVALAASF